MTYTCAVLCLSTAAYEEISRKLKEAGYDHVFGSDGSIDMTHILVQVEESCENPT